MVNTTKDATDRQRFQAMSKFLFVAGQRALDFVNTEIMQEGRPADLFASTADLRHWLREAGVINRPEEDDLKAAEEGAEASLLLHDARKLREALRSMAEALAHERPIPAASLKAINDQLLVLRESSQIRSEHGQYRLEMTSGPFRPRQALARVARSAAELLANGRLNRVKKCGNPACILYFLDTTRNHARQWCSMASCGNRMKVTAFYRRHPRRK